MAKEGEIFQPMIFSGHEAFFEKGRIENPMA
jgi:hypothetical protein